MNPLLDPSAHPVIGHRGNSAHAPENTLESFRQAIALGADAIELDVRLTADGEVVVMHDPTVERTTDGSGAIASLTLDAIRRLDAGARFTRDGGRSFPYRGRGIRVPTFLEVLEQTGDTPILIEIKTRAASAKTREIIEGFGATTRCAVESFDAAAMVPFRGSRIAIGASQPDVQRLLGRALLGTRPASLPYVVMSIPRTFRGIPLPMARLVSAASPSGCVVHVWTVNDPAIARRLWKAGVRGIVTDDPAVMLEARRNA
jgi:glycerophosphoryl diester phosphodiesterase